MKNRFLYNLILPLMLVVSLISCNQQDDTCRKSRKVTLNATFYTDFTNDKGKYVKEKLVLDSLTVKGVGIETLIYNNKKKTDVMELPLQVFKETSSYSLTFNDIVDTIIVKHKNNLEFLSVECGSIRTYSIDTVFFTKHFIDSIAIQQKNVNTIKIENLQIYHHK